MLARLLASESGRGHFFRLCLFALRRLRYLCFDIFLRRFFTSEPIEEPHIKGEILLSWSRLAGIRSNYATHLGTGTLDSAHLRSR